MIVVTGEDTRTEPSIYNGYNETGRNWQAHKLNFASNMKSIKQKYHEK
jgi:hypothetical protein